MTGAKPKFRYGRIFAKGLQEKAPWWWDGRGTGRTRVGSRRGKRHFFSKVASNWSARVQSQYDQTGGAYSNGYRKRGIEGYS